MGMLNFNGTAASSAAAKESNCLFNFANNELAHQPLGAILAERLARDRKRSGSSGRPSLITESGGQQVAQPPTTGRLGEPEFVRRIQKSEAWSWRAEGRGPRAEGRGLRVWMWIWTMEAAESCTENSRNGLQTVAPLGRRR